MIYLDNAATSWPKPPGVIKAMERAVVDFGSNPRRGVHRGVVGANKIVFHVRELLAQLFGIQDPDRIIFTLNATHGLNLAIQGSLKSGDHVITTSMEHNSVWRPLKYLERNGIELQIIQCDEQGRLNPNDIEGGIKENTRLIVTTHASNVTGTVMPVEKIGKIARKHGVPYLVDASQTAGVLPINVQELNIDLLAFPGHKGLLGPQGTGGLYIAPSVALEPLIQGGTGNKSELEFQPETMPDKYESGTLNTVGIAGLGAGIEYILTHGTEEILQKEVLLCQRFLEEVQDLQGIRIYGSPQRSESVPVISLNLGRTDSDEVGHVLDQVYKIAVRTGLHCAPQAHATIGTIEQGTVRISPSSFNTEQDISDTVAALREIGREMLSL